MPKNFKFWNRPESATKWCYSVYSTFSRFQTLIYVKKVTKTMLMLIFWIFYVYVSLFWKVPYSFRDAQFFPRSSYDPKSSPMKKYEVSAFKRTVERPSSHPRSKVILYWSSKIAVLFSFPQIHHLQKNWRLLKKLIFWSSKIDFSKMILRSS